MNYDSVADLKADALFRAGEPTDGSSDFESVVVTYLNAIQQGLLIGGPFGTRPEAGLPALPIVDWWWARKLAVLSTDAAITTGTVTLTKHSTTVTFSDAPTVDVTDWFLVVGTRIVVPQIVAHVAMSDTATLDAPWPDVTTTETYVLANLRVPLPADWLRPVGAGRVTVADPPAVSWLRIVDWSTLEAMAPRASLAEGVPRVAALMDETTLEVRAWTESPARLELPYLALPADLATGGTPVLPRHHRRLLAVGAALLILLDKADDKATALVSEFRGLHAALVQEHTHRIRRLSPAFGQIHPRPGARASRLVTASGIVLDEAAFGQGPFGDGVFGS
ncbi:MAG TPA: hypothetical protein VF406_10890 [Thermodesulfobacteriota bacterium]